MNKEIRELICIRCPVGCHLKVTIEDGKAVDVEGNSCPRGYEYGIEECTRPVRILTSSVMVTGGQEEILSVKTEKGIPKEMVIDAAKALKGITVKAPVKIGDVIIKDILHTGVNVIATREIKEK